MNINNITYVHGYLPGVFNVEFLRACQQLFELIPIVKAYQMLLKVLKSSSQIDVEDFLK